MIKSIVIVGAGGFGREVIDVVEAVNASRDSPTWAVAGVVDDAPTDENLQRLERRGIAFLGDSETALDSATIDHFVIGIGSPRVRRAVAERLEARGMAAATLVHPSVTLGSEVMLGDGTVICAGARLTTNIRVGRHVHLNLNVTVGHDTEIQDFVSVNPLASVSGDCTIESEVLLGVGAIVLNQITVGSGAVVGGAACVVRHVPPGVTVKGVPAR